MEPQADDVDRSLVRCPSQLGDQGGQVLLHSATARHAGVDLEMEASRHPLRPGRGHQGLELGKGGDRQVQVSRQGGAQGRVIGRRPGGIHDGHKPGEDPGRLARGIPRGAGHTGLIKKRAQRQGLGELSHSQP